MLESIRLSRGGKLEGEMVAGDPDYTLAEVCRKLGHDTEAAYWFGRAAEAGSVMALEEIGKLYLEKPSVTAILPSHLVTMLLEADRQVPEAERQEVDGSSHGGVEEEQADRLVADKSLSVRDRVAALRSGASHKRCRW